MSNIWSPTTNLSHLKLGLDLGRGEYKSCREILNTNQVLLITLPYEGDSLEIFQEELVSLKTLNGQGIPTVNYLQTGYFEGRPAGIMDRYVISSRDFEYKVHPENYITDLSIPSLEEIREKLLPLQYQPDDLQFLIDKDGRFWVNDPSCLVKFDKYDVEYNHHTFERHMVIARRGLFVRKAA